MHKHGERGKKTAHRRGRWLSNYRDDRMMRGFGAMLRNDLCVTNGTFFFFTVLLFEVTILKGNQRWLMNLSSCLCTSYWNTVIRYLSFATQCLIPVKLLSAAFLLTHKAIFLPLYYLSTLPLVSFFVCKDFFHFFFCFLFLFCQYPILSFQALSFSLMFSHCL